MQQELLLKCLIFCCFLLLVQNIFQSLGQNENVTTTSFSMVVPKLTSSSLPRLLNTRAAADSESSSSSPNDNMKKRDLLLSVPFYVYEDLAWTKATIGGKKVDKVANPPFDNETGKAHRFKHGSDYWMMKASLLDNTIMKGHPMRTHNMSEAKLFFVPWLMNFFDSRIWKQQKLCVKKKV
mmetsp:Transcript_42657/g.103169  ORF Transcript_42657/g.103169 Transcript_42657/m.103169 type:complete len:180 (+) Transcript_42657:103-642(+)